MEKSLQDKCFERQKDQHEHVQKSVGINIYKSFSHKYIRKEPDGKGGWNYEYPEDKSNISKDDQYFIDQIGELKKEKEKADIKYNYYQSMFELKNALESLRWGKVDWEDYNVKVGRMKEDDKREGKLVFDKYDFEALIDNHRNRYNSAIKRVNSTLRGYKEEIDQKQVSELKKILRNFDKARIDRINTLEKYLKEGYGY